METKMSEIGAIRAAVTLIGFISAGSAGAQQPLNTGNLPATSVQAASCTEVAWEKDLLAQYPQIGDGCQEVVMVEGKKWARFSAELVSNHRDGSVTLDFKNRQRRSLGELTVMPAPDQSVSIGNRNYRFSQLTQGQELNLYVPEGVFAVAVEPGAPPEQLAQIVREPVRLAQAAPAPGLLAQANPAPTPTAQRLPNTAGPLPLFAVVGLVSLLGGLGLTIRRRLFSRQ